MHVQYTSVYPDKLIYTCICKKIILSCFWKTMNACVCACLVNVEIKNESVHSFLLKLDKWLYLHIIEVIVVNWFKRIRICHPSGGANTRTLSCTRCHSFIAIYETFIQGQSNSSEDLGSSTKIHGCSLNTGSAKGHSLITYLRLPKNDRLNWWASSWFKCLGPSIICGLNLQQISES